MVFSVLHSDAAYDASSDEGATRDACGVKPKEDVSLIPQTWTRQDQMN